MRECLPWAISQDQRSWTPTKEMVRTAYLSQSGAPGELGKMEDAPTHRERATILDPTANSNKIQSQARSRSFLSPYLVPLTGISLGWINRTG